MQRYLKTIYESRKVARNVLLGVLLLFGMGALWAWQYSASAIVLLTSSNTEQARATAVDAARSKLDDGRLAAIMEQMQLYPEMVRTRGAAWAIRYIRSRISLQAVWQGKNNTGEVRVTYVSSERATVIKVANALAQSLKPSAAELLSATSDRQLENVISRPTAGQLEDFLAATTERQLEDFLAATTERQLEDFLSTTTARQLEDCRSELKQLAARQKWATDEGLRASLRRPSLIEDKNKLSVLEQQRGQISDQGRVGSSAAPVSVRLPETSAAKAIQQQIKDADGRLIELRQRYTDEYPDVQDTQEQLQELRSKLNRLQVESPRYEEETILTRDDGRITREEEQIRADQARAQKEIRRDEATIETNRAKFAESTVASAYALELDRYDALLRAQRNVKEYQEERYESAQPLFMVVQNATRAKAVGIAVNPLYWLTSLLAGLSAATISVLFAHRLKTPTREKIAIGSREGARAAT